MSRHLLHNLRIRYGEDGDSKDFYAALDTSDIQALRIALDRAEKKARGLQEILESSKVTYLDVEE